mmetsp:Transcript_3676/g.4324  ORF Transcript_3676/g.4324 Transcript_3676/m.4324 type:complete len:515 (+) Transcript_3676:177-1721(+)
MEDSDSDSSDELLNFVAFPAKKKQKLTPAEPVEANTKSNNHFTDNIDTARDTATATADIDISIKSSLESKGEKKEKDEEQSGIQDVSVGDNENSIANVDIEAQRIANTSNIPIQTKLNSSTQLYWHFMKKKRTKLYYPCKECHPDDAIGLDVPQQWDNEKKALVQYIEEGCQFDGVRLISRGVLVPFHGHGHRGSTSASKKTKKNSKNDIGDDNDNDEQKQGGKRENESDMMEKQKWCSKTMTLYVKQIRNLLKKKKNTEEHDINVRVRAMELYLQRVLDTSIEREKDLKLKEEKEQEEYIQEFDEVNENVGDSLSSKIVETKISSCAVATNNNTVVSTPSSAVISQETCHEESHDSDEDSLSDMESIEYKHKSESIRPHDIIEYYEPIGIFGDKRWLKQAQVLAVDPRGDPILQLSDGNYLDKETKVKRVMILRRGKMTDFSKEGLYKQIQEYKLRKAVWKGNDNGEGIKSSGILMKAEQFREVIKKTQETMVENVKAAGLGDCTDFMYAYGK